MSRLVTISRVVRVILIVSLVVLIALLMRDSMNRRPVSTSNLDEEEEGRTYYVVAPSAMAHNFHTHVQVTGRVSYIKHEADGDVHMRLRDDQGFVVAECIPKLPCSPLPRRGQTVTVRGISRIDGEHKWPEVHPVEEMRIAP